VGVELADEANRSRRRALVDSVVAATALARNRVVVTAGRDGFTDLPGVSVRLVPGSVGKD
jgi:predicted nucleic acid-binding protein